jgi:hypothetical protein
MQQSRSNRKWRVALTEPRIKVALGFGDEFHSGFDGDTLR